MKTKITAAHFVIKFIAPTLHKIQAETMIITQDFNTSVINHPNSQIAKLKLLTVTFIYYNMIINYFYICL